MGVPWWHGAVLYQVYPRSFADSDGDGVGDLPGLRARLPYIAGLGVDALWLSPFYRSPMADFGYDIADHCDVDPRFGTLADAEAVIRDAHDLGLRVVLDFVPNHTSDQHPWFRSARSSRTDPHRGWYIWRDPKPDGSPPNDWRAMFTGEQRWDRDADGQLVRRSGLAPPPGADPSAWAWDPVAGQLYLHTFLPAQPDLDWRNPAVIEAMHDVVRFWLQRGVDGFRIDAIKTVGKPDGLPDLSPEGAGLPEAGLTDAELVHDVAGGLRRTCDEHDAVSGCDTLLIGEVHHPSLAEIMALVGPDALRTAFAFPPVYDRWSAHAWRAHIDEAEAYLASPDGRARDAWPTWVLSNHDVPRHADRFGSEARARAAAVLLLTLRGSVCLYAGEELGLLDADVPANRRVDPGGRDGCRAPIPWTPDPRHGWQGRSAPRLPFPRNASGHDAATEEADPDSVLALYRRLLALRRRQLVMRFGGFAWLGPDDLTDPLPHDVLGWRRTPTAAPTHGPTAPTDVGRRATGGRGGDGPVSDGAVRDGGRQVRGDDTEIVVLVSFVSEPRSVSLRASYRVLVDSRTPSTHGHPFDGRLASDQAVVLERTG
jgi:alpha-glucosidase